MADDNGTQPAPATDPEAQPVPASDRLMGLFALAIAVGLMAIAIDLMSGGALARLIPSRADNDDG